MKAKEVKYYVIGGQYEAYCIGGTPTLIGAKRLAKKNAEYWDNWQGWHIPSIYAAEDTVIIEGPDGYGTYNSRKPKRYAEPVARWNKYLHKWESRDEYNDHD